MTATYTFTSAQVVPISPDEAFRFLRNPQNLHKIMPKSMRLQIDWPSDQLLVLGSRFRTRLVKAGLPIKWDTEVTDFVPGHSFTDIQTNGPFRRWEHTHSIREVAGGTEITDRLEIEMPLGWLGRIAMALFVRRDMEQLFQYRTQRMTELFGQAPAQAPSLVSSATVGASQHNVR